MELWSILLTLSLAGWVFAEEQRRWSTVSFSSSLDHSGMTRFYLSLVWVPGEHCSEKTTHASDFLAESIAEPCHSLDWHDLQSFPAVYGAVDPSVQKHVSYLRIFRGWLGTTSAVVFPHILDNPDQPALDIFLEENISVGLLQVPFLD